MLSESQKLVLLGLSIQAYHQLKPYYCGMPQQMFRSQMIEDIVKMVIDNYDPSIDRIQRPDPDSVEYNSANPEIISSNLYQGLTLLLTENMFELEEIFNLKTMQIPTEFFI